MEERLEQTRATVASLRALLNDGYLTPTITYRRVASTAVVAITGQVGFDECDTWLAAAYTELEAAVAAAGVSVEGPAGALYPTEFFEAEVGDVVAFLPVATHVHVRAGTRVSSFEIPSADLAVLLYRGPFADLDRAYGALGTAVAERGIGAPGPIREHYLVTASDTDDMTEHRTEVCWPITQPLEKRVVGQP